MPLSFEKKMNNAFVRNEQKKAKKLRHEREKVYMEALQGVGNVVGEYVGDGQGECEDTSQAVVGFDSVGADIDGTVEQMEISSHDASPLLFLYDCESTGLSIYNDHIIEIAAEVANCAVPYSNSSFTSLVKTSRWIPTKGTYHNLEVKIYNGNLLVTRVTNITPTMIRGERPLSVVLPMFFEWLITTTSDISSSTGTLHYPGQTNQYHHW